LRVIALVGSLLLSLLAVVAPAAAAPTGGAEYGKKAAADPTPAAPGTDGAQPGQPGTAPLPGSPNPVVPGTKAVLLPDGTAAAPAAAPAPVQKAIWAANAIQDKPYRYGGGHGSFKDSGYDCSGTVSVALNAAGVLKTPLDSGSFLRWGQAGRGDWITVYTNPGHAYAVLAGLRLDTSAAYAPRGRMARKHAKAGEKGPRWRPSRRPSSGFTARHAPGL
jgi:cell wall-associated NlpC family hydrolase